MPGPIQGLPCSPEEEEWTKYGRKLLKQSPANLDKGAQSFITLASSLLTVYTGALTLILQGKGGLTLFNWAMLLCPIILWLICIGLSAYAMFPEKYSLHLDSPIEIPNTLGNMVQTKSSRLKFGAVFFVLAIAFSSFGIIWAGMQSSQDIIPNGEQYVRFVLDPLVVPYAENLSLPVNTNSSITDRLLLLKRLDDGYQVKTPQGSIVEFRKEWVQGLEYG
jgi:hypothetical protein